MPIFGHFSSALEFSTMLGHHMYVACFNVFKYGKNLRTNGAGVEGNSNEIGGEKCSSDLITSGHKKTTHHAAPRPGGPESNGGGRGKHCTWNEANGPCGLQVSTLPS